MTFKSSVNRYVGREKIEITIQTLNASLNESLPLVSHITKLKQTKKNVSNLLKIGKTAGKKLLVTHFCKQEKSFKGIKSGYEV